MVGSHLYMTKWALSEFVGCSIFAVGLDGLQQVCVPEEFTEFVKHVGVVQKVLAGALDALGRLFP